MGADLIHTGKIILDGNELKLNLLNKLLNMVLVCYRKREKTDGLILGMSVAKYYLI